MILLFWLNVWNSSSKKGVGLFLIEWYLSRQSCLQWFLLKSWVQSTRVIKLNRNKTGFLNVLLSFRFIFYIDTFYEVALSEWKKWSQKAWGSCMQFPQSQGPWWVFHSVLWVDSCSAAETAASREGWAPPVRAKHGGPLSQSKQGSDVIVLSLSHPQKRGGFFHVVLFSRTHMPRK